MSVSSPLSDKITEIGEAVEALFQNPKLKGMTGEGWKVYRVGSIVRIDVLDETKES